MMTPLHPTHIQPPKKWEIVSLAILFLTLTFIIIITYIPRYRSIINLFNITVDNITPFFHVRQTPASPTTTTLKTLEYINPRYESMYTSWKTGGSSESQYVPYSNAINNIDLGIFNITTSGRGQFSYIDKLEMTPPGTPPADTIRLYAEDFKGYSFIKYTDDTGMVRQLVRDNVFVSKNEYGSQINKGSTVYDCGSSGNVNLICPARADNISTMPAIGITIENIPDGSFGRVMMVGILEKINTNAYADGSVLYVSDTVAGGLTDIPPLTPNLTQEIGTTRIQGVGNGEIQVISRALTGDEFGTINNFTVAQNLKVLKDIEYYGNITKGNLIYAEMWNYSANASAWTFTISTAGIYYNLTGISAGSINGFTHTSNAQTSGGSYLTASVSGLYEVDFSISFGSTGSGLYGVSVAKNFDNTASRNCYARRKISADGDVGNIGASCLLNLSPGDTINIQAEDESTPVKSILIHTVNLNLKRIGD